MNTLQLNKALRSDPWVNLTFLGVFASDKLPSLQKNTCFVANTEPSSLPGAHWVCFYIDDKCHFFDSYGRDPKIYFTTHLNDYTYNKQQVQSFFSACCGQYCIFYLCLKARGLSDADILLNFCSNLQENDEFVTDWVNKNFDLDLPVVDLDFIVCQVARAESI